MKRLRVVCWLSLFGGMLLLAQSDPWLIRKNMGSLGSAYDFLYSFGSTFTDGEQPRAALIRDNAGNLYGTTSDGGAGNVGGTVFKLDASGQETVLYSFCPGTDCTDGYGPEAGLIQDAAGNLYGTTVGGGANGFGTIFKVDPSGQETVLYSFCSALNCADGSNPRDGLIQDTSGNFYGTTPMGGTNNKGTIF